MTPSSGRGSGQTFSAQYADPNGFADLTQVFLLMNTAVDARNACYLRYEPFLGMKTIFLLARDSANLI